MLLNRRRGGRFRRGGGIDGHGQGEVGIDDCDVFIDVGVGAGVAHIWCSSDFGKFTFR